MESSKVLDNTTDRVGSASRRPDSGLEDEASASPVDAVPKGGKRSKAEEVTVADPPDDSGGELGDVVSDTMPKTNEGGKRSTTVHVTTVADPPDDSRGELGGVATDMMPIPPAMPRLARQNRVTNPDTARPGAFFAGIGRMELARIIPFNLVGRATGGREAEPGTLMEEGTMPAPVPSGADNNDHPVAQPVTENSNLDLPQAREVDESKAQSRRQKALHSTMRVVASGLLVVLAIVLLLCFTLRKSDNDEMPRATPALTPAPVMSPEQHVQTLLPNYTLEAISNEWTPQFKAYQC